jgi:RES domain-containing protein
MSGDGAKSKGGRFNPVGISALYLARTVEGCFLEQAHGFPLRFSPLTVCTYDLDIEDIADLTTDLGRRSAKVQLPELQCAWAEDMAAGKESASWKIAKATDWKRRFRDYCALIRAWGPAGHAQRCAVEMGT